ncbi:tyrosine-type recombinase/integrase [Streptococcus dysgalactiae]|uniref:tyrosine-type recombinase/integrase n=1 Tax=Streptococcus dysgalactiae TaxID=1334 RepID=UPI0021B11141|nr:site-specific integrase [Streptococcus dysgalactiae]
MKGLKMKYNKTKYPNIFWYETQKGKRYYVRRGYYLKGKKKEANKSNIKTLQEARAALAEIERKIENNEFAYNKNLTVDQYWPIYCKKRIEKGKWAPDTVEIKESIYKTHFKAIYGDIKMKDIIRDDYEEYINNMLKTYSKYTVVQNHGVLNAMLNHAKNNKLIADNPINKIDIGDSQIKPRNKHVPLSIFKQWDAKARELFDDLEYLAVRITYLGARKSEDYGITLGGLIKQPSGNYLIKLSDSRTYKRPNGGGMKTRGSERYIMADEVTSRLIDKAIPTVNRIAKKYGRILGPNDFLFITDYAFSNKQNRGKPWPVYRIYNLFNKVNRASGLHITPHMMRHFFTTQGQIAKVPIEHMAAALGHSTSYMTQKYTHIKDEVAGSVTESFINAIK